VTINPVHTSGQNSADVSIAEREWQQSEGMNQYGQFANDGIQVPQQPGLPPMRGVNRPSTLQTSKMPQTLSNWRLCKPGNEMTTKVQQVE